MGCSFKRKKSITINNTFRKLLDESNRKLKKIRVDKGSNFTISQLNHGYKLMT